MTTAALFANKKNLVAPFFALVQDVKYLVFTSFNVAGDWLGEQRFEKAKTFVAYRINVPKTLIN